MKVIERIAYIIGILMVLWILISWADVLMHNSPRNPSDPHDWNLFVLVAEIGA
jgi:hypothetical protein